MVLTKFVDSTVMLSYSTCGSQERFAISRSSSGGSMFHTYDCTVQLESDNRVNIQNRRSSNSIHSLGQNEDTIVDMFKRLILNENML